MGSVCSKYLEQTTSLLRPCTYSHSAPVCVGRFRSSSSQWPPLSHRTHRVHQHRRSEFSCHAVSETFPQWQMAIRLESTRADGSTALHPLDEERCPTHAPHGPGFTNDGSNKAQHLLARNPHECDRRKICVVAQRREQRRHIDITRAANFVRTDRHKVTRVLTHRKTYCLGT